MKLCIMGAITIASLTAITTAALAQDTNCNFSTSAFATIEGNLVVPDNATCHLSASGSIGGNVTVGENASLELEGNFTIQGYLQAINCAYVAINPYGYGSTVIGKTVLIKNCTGNSPALGQFFPAGAAFGMFGPNGLVGGALKCYMNSGPCILRNTHIGGNVYLVNNKTATPSQVKGNFIAKGLHCSNNVPAPTGSGNLIAGNPNSVSEGQCKGF
jgi:hypothetical protein